MKRIVSILLVCVMLLSLTTVSVSSASSFRGWFYTECCKQLIGQRYGEPRYYREIYYHYEEPNDTDSTNIDWALVECYILRLEDLTDTVYGPMYTVVDNVLLYIGRYYIEIMPFASGYAVYDARKNKFTDLCDVNVDDFEGLSEYLRTSMRGRPVGDVDQDGVLSILDATQIQMNLAGLSEFSDSDYVYKTYTWVTGKRSVKYISDYDRDGERTVLDATTIQMKLAKVS